MTALSIDNLAIDNAMDKAALEAVSGGQRRVGIINVGWSDFSQTGFRYTGRYQYRFLGFDRLPGIGLVRKYNLKRQYKNVQTKYHNRIEFWK